MISAIRLLRKRKRLTREEKFCPKCKSEQVQLKEWIEKTVWKCRICKHVF